MATAQESLLNLKPCLLIREESIAASRDFMTAGDLQLNFLENHALLTSVVFIYPHYLRWPEGGGDALLQDGKRLTAWLVAHGWQEPFIPTDHPDRRDAD
jgi:hypothetical protein